MYNLFAFAIGARLVAFIVFVACVYAGNLLFAKLERRQTKFLWKITFVTLYSLFSPPCNLCRLVCILLWIKCLDTLLMLGLLFGDKDSKFMTRKFHPIYQDEVVFAFF